MLIGYMRVSKADGSQTVDLQKDALLEALFGRVDNWVGSMKFMF